MRIFSKQRIVVTGAGARSGMSVIMNNPQKFITVATYAEAYTQEALIKKAYSQPEVILLEMDLTELSDPRGNFTLIRLKDKDIDVVIVPIYNDVDKAFAEGFLREASACFFRNAEGQLSTICSGDNAAAKKAESPFENIIVPLSPQEIHVLKLMTENNSCTEIASTLEIEEKTAEKYIEHTCRKLMACSGYGRAMWLDQ
jgi:DNA-binding NarL/FixJ family response regulator